MQQIINALHTISSIAVNQTSYAFAQWIVLLVKGRGLLLNRQYEFESLLCTHFFQIITKLFNAMPLMQ